MYLCGPPYVGARRGSLHWRPMNELVQQLQVMRPQLMRYARSQLRNDAWAEDAVSETMLVAFEKLADFRAQSQLKTWVIGILKHKLIDEVRRHAREITTSPEGGDDIKAGVFADDGHFREMPRDWGSPDAALQQRDFFIVLEACTSRLPNQLGRVFLMREWLELSTDEICKELDITPTNLWVMLHRARLRLRECLQIHWFNVPRS